MYKLSLNLARFLVTALLVLGGMNAFSLGVSADVTSERAQSDNTNITTIAQHCIAKLPKKLESACSANNNEIAKWSRNVASYHCDTSKDAQSKLNQCVVDKANGYIDEAYKKNPSSPSDFHNKLVDLLHSKGGSLKVFNPKANTSLAPKQENCDPNDGLCADCQNGGKGCITCDNGACQDAAANPSLTCDQGGCDLVRKYVNPGINLLSMVFGLIAIASSSTSQSTSDKRNKTYGNYGDA